jgi:acetyl esterase/lipase
MTQTAAFAVERTSMYDLRAVGCLARALLVLTAAPLLLPAGDAPPSGTPQVDDRFRRFDRNGDGVVTPDELKNSDLFKRLDANGDGRVTLEEFRASQAGRGPATTGGVPGAGIAPTFENVSYGPHERNVLDFWQAKVDAPAPVVVFIHGGGFVGGDKSKARTDPNLKACVDAGIHFAAIHYRFRQDAPIQDILRDSARAIQFIRSKAAEWKVDKARIAAYGGSAGAGTSLWLASHDDLADPSSADPVLRESSRLAAAGCQSTQATYDLTRWESVVGPFKAEFRQTPNEVPEFYHFKAQADLETPEGKKVLADCDMLGLLSKGDAPVFVSNGGSEADPKNRNEYVHHPRHALAVKKRCDEAGVECVMAAPRDETASGPREPLIAFLFRHLGVKTPRGSPPAGKGGGAQER